jgi:hypothetical protein
LANCQDEHTTHEAEQIFSKKCNPKEKQQYMLKNSEGEIKNRQLRETGNIGYTKPRPTKQTHNAICVRHHY